MDIQKFEEAYLNAGGKSSELEKEDGEYTSSKAQMAWEMWKAAKAQSLPEGFVLVLKNASQEMIKQGYEAHDGFFTLGSVRNVWDAMIEAQEQIK